MKSNKKQILELIYFVVVFLVMLIPILTCGNLPGLYLDAANPDYGAVQILHPQPYQVNWMVGWPFLTQVYHGNLNMLISLIVVFLTGTTSVLQHQIINVTIAYICCCLVYLILRECKVSNGVCKLVTVILATIPSLLTICFAQYYIELPGTALILLAILLFIKWRNKDNKKNGVVFWIMFLAGMAFYSYFNFLFFFPALFLGVILNSSCKADKIVNAAVSVLGYIVGCSLYFIGYLSVYLNTLGVEQKAKNMFMLLLAVFIYGESIVLYRLIVKQKVVDSMIAGIAYIAVFVVEILLVLPTIKDMATGLNVMGNEISFIDKIYCIYMYIWNVLSGASTEVKILSENVSGFTSIYFKLFLIVSIGLILYECVTKKIRKNSDFKQFFIMFAMYCICSLVLASRMQVQHFVPIIFVIFIIIALAIDYIRKIFKSDRMGKIVQLLLVAISLIMVALNCRNNGQIVKAIKMTGGTAYFSDQINELAYDAMDNLERGEKEIYIFNDWGFLCGFDYLTQNKVAFSTSIDENSINTFLYQGYQVNICYWNNDDSDMYEQLLRKCAPNGEIQKVTRKQRDGKVAFYQIKLNCE